MSVTTTLAARVAFALLTCWRLADGLEVLPIDCVLASISEDSLDGRSHRVVQFRLSLGQCDGLAKEAKLCVEFKVASRDFVDLVSWMSLKLVADSGLFSSWCWSVALRWH